MGLQLVWTKHLWLSWCENLGAEAWYLHQAFEGLQSYVLFSSAGILRQHRDGDMEMGFGNVWKVGQIKPQKSSELSC